MWCPAVRVLSPLYAPALDGHRSGQLDEVVMVITLDLLIGADLEPGKGSD
jgi:hypothetical protein